MSHETQLISVTELLYQFPLLGMADNRNRSSFWNTVFHRKMKMTDRVQRIKTYFNTSLETFWKVKSTLFHCISTKLTLFKRYVLRIWWSLIWCGKCFLYLIKLCKQSFSAIPTILTHLRCPQVLYLQYVKCRMKNLCINSFCRLLPWFSWLQYKLLIQFLHI